MTKATTLLATLAVVLVVFSGTALAAQIRCDGGTCTGTSKADRLTGTPGLDTIRGGGGADALYGQAGADTLSGGFGPDRIFGGAGSDTVTGGPARDRILGGPGRDEVDADVGPDYVNVAGDGQTDSVSCGIGEDTAVVDNADLARSSQEDFIRLSSCENVTVR